MDYVKIPAIPVDEKKDKSIDDYFAGSAFPKPGKKPKKSKTSPIRKSANGQECQVRLPGCTNQNVVLAHRNGGGAGQKRPDYQAAYCCEYCHSVVDGKIQTNIHKDVLELYFFEAIFRTQDILVELGYIQYDGI